MLQVMVSVIPVQLVEMEVKFSLERLMRMVVLMLEDITSYLAGMVTQ